MTTDIVQQTTRDPTVESFAVAEMQRLSSVLDPLVQACSGQTVEIAPDPVELGLKQFNEKLAFARKLSNDASECLKLAIHEQSLAASRLKRARKAYDEQLNLLLVHDPDVNQTKGQSMKLAVAKDKAQRHEQVVQACEALHAYAKSCHDAIKLTYDNLKDTTSDLMKQLAVVKQQIALGEVQFRQFPVSGGEGSTPASSVERDIADALQNATGKSSGVTDF